MKEHPILFKPEMVRAILEGRKTQTRRVVSKYNSILSPHGDWDKLCWDGNCVYLDKISDGLNIGSKAPLPFVDDGYYPETRYMYLHVPYDWSDQQCIFRVYPRIEPGDYLYVKKDYFTKKSEATLWLEVIEVRVQRLQDITPNDARAEGMQPFLYRDHFINTWNEINKIHTWESNPWVWVIEFKRI